jgi:ribosomal protein S12 methylthiotransferase
MNANFSLISLGCARTLVDSEAMVQSIQSVGFTLVAEGTTESITVLNTCSFIQAAIDETESNIERLIDQKNQGHIRYICVVGCYPSRFKPEVLEDKYPQVDLWCTTRDEATLHTRMAKRIFNQKYTPHTTKPYTKISPSHYAYLKISEGCDNWCAFCTIPKIRGTHRSKSIAAIREDAKRQMAMGAKELIIVAEDTTAWGEDIYGTPCLETLLDGLRDLDAWIRLMYIFPARVTPKLIHAIATTPNVIPYIDMPIQHVNTELLSRMNRRHDKAFLENIITDMRAAIPHLALRTTFICGFPGETDDHVHEICDFLDTHTIDHIGCFTYSPEPNTRAYTYGETVPESVRRERVSRIMDHHFRQRGDRQLRRLGETVILLYEGNGCGRSVYEAPDVDNVIRLDIPNPPYQPGDMIAVRLTGVSGIDFIGKPVDA